MNVSPTSTDATTGMTAATKNAGLGKDDFLKLLVGQLKNQNPMNPSGDQDFIQQMTMFSTLEQMTNMAASSGRVESALADNQALQLIGRTVTYAKADGTTAQGTVEQVTYDGTHPLLTIGGVAGISPALVSEVR